MPKHQIGVVKMPDNNSDMTAATSRTRSFGVRLVLAIAVMLLPLVAGGALGVVSFRSTARALQEFQTETVDESTRIEAVRDMLVPADDAGEAYVETDDPAQGERFAELSREIDDGFVDLATLGTAEERSAGGRCPGTMGSRIRLRLRRPPWLRSVDRDALLDPFHDDSTKRARCWPTWTS